jgi:DNA-binding transcriptional ArsR family regulator
MLDEDFLKAIGHPTRLRALVLFEQQPGTASELAKDLGIPRTRVTSHIAMLDDAGLIFTVEVRQQRGFTEHLWATRTHGWGPIAQLLGDAERRSAAAPAPKGELRRRLRPPKPTSLDAKRDPKKDDPPNEDD